MADETIATDSLKPPQDAEYVVVARRYRPNSFDELIGQEHVARALASAIETNRVGHAYLFTGARGVGKTSAARILAKALNCQQGPTPQPCNECEICQSITAGSDVDVLEIDGASNRGIDEIRQLRQNAAVRPSRARLKIYIIDEVHMLTKEAFNALLKTLEEPPEHVKFIFATTEPNKIPITILSRCQRFDFAGIDSAAIQTRLQQIAEIEGVEVEDEALELLARRASGSMRDSQSLLEQLLALGAERIAAADVHALLGTAPSARISKLAGLLIDRDARGALVELDEALAGGTEVAQLLDQLLGYFRDCMVASVGGEAGEFLHVTKDEADRVAEVGRDFGVPSVLAVVQILEQASTRMRSSLHARTLAEMALVQVASLENLDEIGGLIAQLESGQPAGARRAASPAPRADSKKNAPAAADRVAARGQATAALSTTDHSLPEKPNSESSAASVTSQTGGVGYLAPLSAENAADIWQHVLDALGGMAADNASLAESVAILAPNRLAVRFRAKYTSCKAFCERVEQKSRLEQGLAEATGQSIHLQFESIADEPESAPQTGVAPKVSKRELEAEIAGRPIVRRALELFDAENPRIEPPDASG